MDKTNEISLVNHLLSQCDGEGDITLPKDTLEIVLRAYKALWDKKQIQIISTYSKIAKR